MSPTIMSTKTALGRFAEDYLLWPHADVLYFNGIVFRIAVQQHGLPQRGAGHARRLPF